MYAASDMGPFSGAYAAGLVLLAEKSSLVKNLGPFCCHKNTSFILTRPHVVRDRSASELRVERQSLGDHNSAPQANQTLRLELSGSLAPYKLKLENTAKVTVRGG